MPYNFHNDTSYKYRWNQKTLMGKILSGTLDEDLCISNLVIDGTLPSNWWINPIFRGSCFSEPHGLDLCLNITISNFPALNTLFENSSNISALKLSIDYSGGSSVQNVALTSVCHASKDLVRAELICGDLIKISGLSGGFYQCPKLKTLIIRSNNQISLTGQQTTVSSPVDALILDSPALATISNATTLDSSAFVSGGTGGTIYIPKSLYDHLGDGTSLDYKAATNWSTIDARGTITWAQIEGSGYEA